MLLASDDMEETYRPQQAKLLALLLGHSQLRCHGHDYLE
jgi:hypothetical protein